MKKPLIFLLTSFLILGPTLVSCNNENNEQTKNPDEGETNKEDNGNSETEGDSSGTPDGDDSSQDETEKLPDFDAIELKNLAEAKAICDKIDNSKKENFTDEYVRTKGKVLSDFAISSTYHFIILADETGTFPIAVNASNAVTSYFYIGETYEVVGQAGNYYKHSCLKVTKRKDLPTIFPISPEDSKYERVNVETLSTPKTISEVYDEAYTIEVEDNKTNYKENLYKFSATYITKITDGLALVFDGENHMILHGEKKINNHFLENKKYEFYCFPSVSQGKRSAECVGYKSLNVEDPNAVKNMGEVAKLKTVEELYNIDRYNDKKALYPNIIKVEGYITNHYASEKNNLALVDDPKTNPSYSQKNERPKAIYAKNHIISDYDLANSKSILLKYCKTEPKKKGTFYFVPTEYASSLHVYKGFFLDSLIEFK